jgi:hypothetical protein
LRLYQVHGVILMQRGTQTTRLCAPSPPERLRLRWFIAMQTQNILTHIRTYMRAHKQAIYRRATSCTLRWSFLSMLLIGKELFKKWRFALDVKKRMYLYCGLTASCLPHFSSWLRCLVLFIPGRRNMVEYRGFLSCIFVLSLSLSSSPFERLENV